MSYLIFNTKAEAVTRADQEGQLRNLPYHSDNGVTRYVTYPVETGDNKWALDVTDYTLSASEDLAKQDSFVQQTIPDGQEL